MMKTTNFLLRFLLIGLRCFVGSWAQPLAALEPRPETQPRQPELQECGSEIQVQETLRFELIDEAENPVFFLDIEQQAIIEESFVLSYNELVSCSFSSIHTLDRAEVFPLNEPAFAQKGSISIQELSEFAAILYGSSSCGTDSFFASGEEEFESACCACVKPSKTEYFILLEEIVLQSTGLFILPLFDDPTVDFCPDNVFQSTVLLSIPYEDYLKYGMSLEQELVGAFIESYNIINAKDENCDPWDRLALEGSVNVANQHQQPPRQLEEEAPLELPVFSYIDLLLHITGSCRGCPSDQNLFDQVSDERLLLQIGRPAVTEFQCHLCDDVDSRVGSPNTTTVISVMNEVLETTSVADIVEVEPAPCAREQTFFSELIEVDISDSTMDLTVHEWEILFLDTYSRLSNRYCDAPFFTQVHSAKVLPENEKTSSLFLEVVASCRGDNCPIFFGRTREEFALNEENNLSLNNEDDVCYCPTRPLGSEGVPYAEFVESLTQSNSQYNENSDCPPDSFQSTVIFSVPTSDVYLKDPNGIEEAIAQAFVESYNQVNLAGGFCDPLGRQAVQANAAIINQEQHRGLFEDSSEMPSEAPSPSPTSLYLPSYIHILLFISGSCFGCPSDQNLFNQVTGSGSRNLQNGTTNCIICDTTDTLGSPQPEQVLKILNEILENTTEVVDLVEVDPVPCASELEMFSETVTLYLPDLSLSATSPEELSVAFLDSYNRLTKHYCAAPLFTTVTGAELLSNFDSGGDLFVFRVYGTCHGTGCSLFADGSKVDAPTNGNEDGICYCASEPIDFRLPTKDEFAVALTDMENDKRNDDCSDSDNILGIFQTMVAVSITLSDIDVDFELIKNSVRTAFMAGYGRTDTVTCDPLSRRIDEVVVDFSNDDGRTGTRTFKFLLHVSVDCIGCEINSSHLFGLSTESIPESCACKENPNAIHAGPTQEEVAARMQLSLQNLAVKLNYVQEVELVPCHANKVATTETMQFSIFMDNSLLPPRLIENAILDTYDAMSVSRCEQFFSAMHRAVVLDLEPLSVELQGTYRGIAPSLFYGAESMDSITTCYCPVNPYSSRTPTEQEFKDLVEANLQILLDSTSDTPSLRPSLEPSSFPSIIPTVRLSLQPSSLPSPIPTAGPSLQPSSLPSPIPTDEPSIAPSSRPSSGPSQAPTETPVAWRPPGQAAKPWRGPPGHAHGRPNNPHISNGNQPGRQPGRQNGHQLDWGN